MNKTPIFNALLSQVNNNTASFDVPGHKQMKINSPFYNYIGANLLEIDYNSMKELDLLSNPEGVIKQSQSLMAKSFEAAEAFFLVNGSSVGVQTMILSSVKPGEKIILPRNVHKSVISGLILSGAVPVFFNTTFNDEFGISNNIIYEELESVIAENLDAKAVLIINPTYFGAIGDLKRIIELIKKHKMACLVDQAHGAHFPFCTETKKYNAVSLGADLVCVSMHKTAGSLTQSSVLLLNEGIIPKYKVQKNLNMLHSTSASYLLLASLEAARDYLDTNGEVKIKKIIEITKKIREEINQISGLKILETDEKSGISALDPLKITIKVNDLGVSGFEFYTHAKQKYNLQLELAETYVILVIIGINDNEHTLKRLVESLKATARDLDKGYQFKFNASKIDHPEQMITPREAFYANKEELKIEDALNKISANSIMIYPPGIPVVIPGERIDQKIIDTIKYYNNQLTFTVSEDDEGLVEVIKEEK